MLLNPHTPTERAQWLQQFGHPWNPAYPNLRNIDAGRAAAMDGSESDYFDLVRSFQQLDANVSALVDNLHGRPLHLDGIVGPATDTVFQFHRCPMPDFPPPPGESFNYDDPDIQRAVESMQRAAASETGNGSWPHGCHGKPGIHEVTISYDDSALSAQQKQWLPELKLAAAAAYAAAGVLLTEVPVGQKANIRFYGQNRGGSIIGVAEFNNETCGDSVFCTIVPSYAPSFVRVLILILHEMGHCMNLQHRGGNIMNPSLLLVEPHWVKRESGLIVYQDNSYPTLKDYFGGGPLVSHTPVPIPVPGPTPTDEWDGSVITVQRPGKLPRRFIPALEV